MSFLNKQEIQELGFKKVGENALISRFAKFYGSHNIEIGDNVRIDDFVIISAGQGGVTIGNYVHIAIFASIQGDAQVVISDFVGISSKVSIYSSSDNYFGHSLTNPTVPIKFRKIQSRNIFLGKHVIIGSNSVILPGSILKNGVAIGALSTVNQECDEFYIYSGNPLSKLIKRSKKMLLLETAFLEESSD